MSANHLNTSYTLDSESSGRTESEVINEEGDKEQYLLFNKAMRTKFLKKFFSTFGKVYQLLGTVFYIYMGWSTKGFRPFVAQLLSSIVSFVVDEITGNDEIIEIMRELGVSKKNFVTAINLFSSVLSFGFGFYSLYWCKIYNESNFEYANSVITIINGIINLIQSVVRFKYDDEKFDEVNQWSIFCEVVIQIIIMGFIGR